MINIEKYMRPNEVEINASMELVFENNFKSNIKASFTKNLGNKTRLVGKKGELVIEDTWSANPSIITIKKDKDRIINIDSIANIYSYEIDALSQSILQNKVSTNLFSITIDDIIGNMKIIDKWKS